MTAGTGGMYDPIMSGGDSSISSASKNSMPVNGQQSNNGGITGTHMRAHDFEVEGHQLYIPRPHNLMSHSAP